MRKNFIVLLSVFVCLLGSALAQDQNTLKTAQPNASATIATARKPVVDSKAFLSPAEVASEIASARQLLSAHEIPQDMVTIAALDARASQIHFFSLPKNQFLVKDSDLSSTTQLGVPVRVHIVRANGVNTAATVTAATNNQTLVPLLVQFPISTSNEMAYYTSAHPALLSPEITEAGKTYVRTMLDQAAESLAQEGSVIPADIVDVAEHLCIVEHTDHKRFLSEDHSVLFPEILSLYALNQGVTYRYSVSSAGAGGMIQMIPRTYASIRGQHPNALLEGDFVAGMRDHGNALKAMLLYMNDTWAGLEKNSEVQDALRSGVATKPELLAAGYNSNPMRLPAYLKNGGTAWHTLIPAETQIYLSIYKSIDDTLQLAPRASVTSNTPVKVKKPAIGAGLISWFANSFLNSSVERMFLLMSE
jgi:hypothetical protein